MLIWSIKLNKEYIHNVQCTLLHIDVNSMFYVKFNILIKTGVHGVIRLSNIIQIYFHLLYRSYQNKSYQNSGITQYMTNMKKSTTTAVP